MRYFLYNKITQTSEKKFESLKLCLLVTKFKSTLQESVVM